MQKIRDCMNSRYFINLGNIWTFGEKQNLFVEIQCGPQQCFISHEFKLKEKKMWKKSDYCSVQ